MKQKKAGLEELVKMYVIKWRGIYIVLYVTLYYKENVALKGGQFCL